MPTLEVKIPSMGESITSGVLAKWHVRDGDFVNYVRGANVAGFVKVANAMLAQGVV